MLNNFNFKSIRWLLCYYLATKL